MTKDDLEKEAKERAKDYTGNKERQVAYECGFLDGADVLEKEIKNKISEHKECCKKLAEEYRQRYNEDKTDKLALNMFYHNVIAYNNFETVLSMIEDRNSMIMCFGEPPLLTEKTVEVELNHIAELEDKLANADYQLEGRDNEIDELKEQNRNLQTMLQATREVRVNEDYLKKVTELEAQLAEQKQYTAFKCEEAKKTITDLEYKLTKTKKIIKKFSEFVNNGIEYDPEHPQEHTDLWNKLCEEAEQFLNCSEKPNN